MEITYDEDTVSDLHKDAYGYRPSATFWSQWKAMTPAEKQAEWEYLCNVLEDSIEHERNREKLAIESFEKRVAETIESGAGNRATAIRWILQAEGLAGEEDLGYVCYQLGLPYDYENKFKEVV